MPSINCDSRISVHPNTEGEFVLVNFKNDPNNYYYIKSGLNPDMFVIEGVSKLEEVDIYEEDAILNKLKFTPKDKEIYGKLLIKIGLKAGYKIYRAIKKDAKMKKYEDCSNMDKLTFYVILRNDLNRDLGLQLTDIADITKVIQEDLREKSGLNSKYANWYYDFINLKTNTVILQASGKDLFEDNFIPSEYKDPNVEFNYIWDDEEKVAHNNFRLKEGNITCLGYFGRKKDMPKFVRRLKLFGE